MTILKKKNAYIHYINYLILQGLTTLRKQLGQALLALLYESSINQSLHHSFRHLLASKTLFKIRPC